ncbi:MAG: hypothetical protein ACP5D3_08825 [Sulfurovum sp.]
MERRIEKERSQSEDSTDSCHNEIMTIRHVINGLYRQHVKSPALSLDHTRENILFGMILTTALVGLIAYIPNVIGALDRGHIDTAVVDTLFYFWVIFLLFYKHFTFTQRSLGLIIPIWILSIYLFIRLDITAESVLWLFIAPTLTAILFGLKKRVHHPFAYSNGPASYRPSSPLDESLWRPVWNAATAGMVAHIG